MRKNEVDIMPLHKSMRGKVGTERPSGRAGRIDSIANKSYKEKERQDDFLENIQDHLKRNQAMLPPRSIRLLRSLYLDKLPTNIHTIAIGRGVGDSVVVTQIRRLLKQLKAGIK
jgi:oligoribonuclease (3'-5' exoribonuclease)